MNNNEISGLLSQLPSISKDKSGWPWTEESDPSFYNIKNKAYPKISIVTPSYNQGHYLEETLRSILLQNYPNLELIIIDGGSTDNTIEIIKKYEPWISYWVSEKDRGQSHALNKGFERVSGNWVGWQNSDDIYFKNAFSRIQFNKFKEDILYGNLAIIDNNSIFRQFVFYTPFSFFELKYQGMNIANQSLFFSNKVVKEQKIDENYVYAMDNEYFFRLASLSYKFRYLNIPIGALRVYPEAKSSQIAATIGLDEQIIMRSKYSIKQSKEQWNKQFKIQKSFIFCRKFFYYLIYGNLLTSFRQKSNK